MSDDIRFRIGLRYAECMDHGPYDPAIWDRCPECPLPKRLGVVTRIDDKRGVITIDTDPKEPS